MLTLAFIGTFVAGVAATFGALWLLLLWVADNPLFGSNPRD